MQTPGAALTKGRVVAMLAMGLAITALVLIRVASESGPPGLPDGARAGDLKLEPCDYHADGETLAADCGTLVVPENRNRAHSRLVALPITRIRALAPDGGRPLFHLEGGPGHTNMEFPDADRVAVGRDVVLLGYRGVDGSVRLDCPEVTSALKHSKDFLAESTLDSYAEAMKDCAARLTSEGVDLGGYTLSQRADDFEMARVALGYGQIDLLSESAGTRLAMIYDWRYPGKVGRSVMIGANPPGHFVWDATASDAQIRRYAVRCSVDAGCRARTDDLAATLSNSIQHTPGRWLFLPIKDGNVRVATFYALMESGRTSAPLSGPTALDAWLTTTEGDASGLWAFSLMSDIMFPDSFVWGDMAAVASADREAARRYFASEARAGSILGNPATEFLWAGGRLVDAWPHDDAAGEYSSPRPSDTETLLINGDLDGAAPVDSVREILPLLPKGHQVVLAGLGHTTDFWAEQPAAADRLVNAFLATGSIDSSLYIEAPVDFSPVMSAPAVAKIVAGTMAGMPILALLSIVAVGVRRRRIGRRTTAVLRTAWPILLAPAGWLAAVAVVLPAWPGIPVDDLLLVTLSMAVPVGLGMFLAAPGKDHPSHSAWIDLVGALVGALLGAWFGYDSVGGSVGLLTTVVGASVGANGTLTAIDIVFARSPIGVSPLANQREGALPA